MHVLDESIAEMWSKYGVGSTSDDLSVAQLSVYVPSTEVIREVNKNVQIDCEQNAMEQVRKKMRMSTLNDD